MKKYSVVFLYRHEGRKKMDKFIFAYENKDGVMVSSNLLDVIGVAKAGKLAVEVGEKRGKIKTDRVFICKSCDMDKMYFCGDGSRRMRIITFLVEDKKAMQDIKVRYSFECDSRGRKISAGSVNLFDYDPDFYDDIDGKRGLKWLVKNSELEEYFEEYVMKHHIV